MKSKILEIIECMRKPASRKMEEYLKNTQNKLSTSDYASLSFIIGNESCDLDSAVCAITYANFLRWQYEQIKCKVCTSLHRDASVFKDDLFIPLLNVDRGDFPIKTEVAYCFKEHGIKEEDLIFRNDFNLREIVEKSKPKVVLVDHHMLAKSDQFLIPYVTEIIDHRFTDRVLWPYKGETRSTIEIVGSCATLVAQRIKDLSALMAKDVDYFNAYPVCSELLYSTIILDTANFSKDMNKATPHDEDIVLFLESLLKPSDYETERKQKLERLLNARTDITNLNTAQLLKKDLKICGDILIPTFPILVKEFLTRPEAIQSLNEALGLRNCNLALLLGVDFKNEMKRDIALYSISDQNKVNKLSLFLKSWKPSFELEEETNKRTDGIIYYKQNNLGASRKQYIPAVTQFLGENKK